VAEDNQSTGMGGGRQAKNALRSIVRGAISASTTEGIAPSELQGIALFNMERDEIIRGISSFNDAITTIVDLPNFVERFGAEAATRIALQFVYEYFRRNHVMSYNEDVFEELYCDLLRELESPVWVFRGIANVKYFISDVYPIDLGDGITIRGRSRGDLASLGFGAAMWDRITDDWSGLGASSFVLMVEHSIPKTPDNLILMDSYQLSLKAMRAILALRLCGEGSVGVGPMWVIRASHFNVGIGGLSRVGASIPTLGNSYTWTAKLQSAYSWLFDTLTQIEREEYRSSPGNLSVALRAFTSIYDRWPTASDSQLLDCITALEALLGAENEISFKLSYRVAVLLAGSDDERSSLLKLLKDFYDTRSKVIHGAHLKAKQQTLLQRVDELRNIVKRLLIAFIRLATAKPAEYGKSFWQERLDGALVNAGERDKLRAALGLC
jgi:hypothetical protein